MVGILLVSTDDVPYLRGLFGSGGVRMPVVTVTRKDYQWTCYTALLQLQTRVKAPHGNARH